MQTEFVNYDCRPGDVIALPDNGRRIGDKDEDPTFYNARVIDTFPNYARVEWFDGRRHLCSYAYLREVGAYYVAKCEPVLNR